MTFYWEMFPHASVTPKMHFLEVHMLPWLRKWKVAFWMIGEQGSESIHARFNSIRVAYRSMPNPVELLKVVMTEHYLQIAPCNLLQQSPKRNKKE